MFELNPISVKIDHVLNSTIYTVDNIYRNPTKIVELIKSAPFRPHKHDQTPSYNYKYFYDDRHCILVDEIQPLISWIESLVNQKFKDFGTGATLFTNYQQWVKHPFNSWESSYWYPHLDFGYTALIYLDESNCGTNLYQCKNPQELKRISQCNEHYEPWRSKLDWELVHTIEPKFNRMVIFEADRFYHGLEFKPALFDKRRLNQVMFFEGNYGTV
jgi:hypothetical protein